LAGVFGGTLTHTEHVATDEGDIWHVQDFTTTQIGLTVARGLRPGLGLELVAGIRQVTSRVRFLTPERQPLVLAQGSIHHRNETLIGGTDGALLLHAARTVMKWSLAGRVGVSLPLGSTVVNPFALGRLGLPHEHIQFGTGTFDPLLGFAAGRRLGRSTLVASVDTRVVVYANRHGYRAGDRFHGSGSLTHPIGSNKWTGTLGVDVIREKSETWAGKRETEGNLGRTDGLVLLSVGRPVGRSGAWNLTAQVPFLTQAVGAQIHCPLIMSVGWSR
jgi:hypothetical protein